MVTNSVILTSWFLRKGEIHYSLRRFRILNKRPNPMKNLTNTKTWMSNNMTQNEAPKKKKLLKKFQNKICKYLNNKL